MAKRPGIGFTGSTREATEWRGRLSTVATMWRTTSSRRNIFSSGSLPRTPAMPASTVASLSCSGGNGACSALGDSTGYRIAGSAGAGLRRRGLGDRRDRRRRHRPAPPEPVRGGAGSNQQRHHDWPEVRLLGRRGGAIRIAFEDLRGFGARAELGRQVVRMRVHVDHEDSFDRSKRFDPERGDPVALEIGTTRRNGQRHPMSPRVSQIRRCPSRCHSFAIEINRLFHGMTLACLMHERKFPFATCWKG